MAGTGWIQELSITRKPKVWLIKCLGHKNKHKTTRLYIQKRFTPFTWHFPRGKDTRVGFISSYKRSCQNIREEALTCSFAPPVQEILASVDLFLQLENSIKQGLSSWWATRNVNVHRDNSITTSNNRIRVVVVSTSIGTTAHRNDPPWLWHLVINSTKRMK